MIEFQIGDDNKLFIEKFADSGDRFICIIKDGKKIEYLLQKSGKDVMSSEQINKFISAIVGDDLIIHRQSSLPEVDGDSPIRDTIVAEIFEDDLEQLKRDVAYYLSVIKYHAEQEKNNTREIEENEIEDLKNALARTSVKIPEEALSDVAVVFYREGIRSIVESEVD